MPRHSSAASCANSPEDTADNSSGFVRGSKRSKEDTAKKANKIKSNVRARLPGRKIRRASVSRGKSQSLQPVRRLGCFLELSDLRPACFLRQRNSPAPSCGENALGSL